MRSHLFGMQMLETDFVHCFFVEVIEVIGFSRTKNICFRFHYNQLLDLSRVNELKPTVDMTPSWLT